MNAGKPLEDMTYKVIGAAMSVHNALGPGLKEAAYHRALSLEMERAGLSFETEKAVAISIDGSQVGRLYLDHLVGGQLVVEEKALSHLLTREETAQVITYLCAADTRVGLLLNFGRRQLEYHRSAGKTDVVTFDSEDGTRHCEAWREGDSYFAACLSTVTPEMFLRAAPDHG